MNEARKIIRENDIEIIHSNTLSPAIAGSILGFIFKIPVITTFHHVGAIRSREYQTLIAHKRKEVFLFDRLLRLLCEKLILALPVSCIHSVSVATAAELRKFGYKGRIEVIPNGLDLRRFDGAAHAIPYLPYLLFIGRLVGYKNLGVVIQAFAETSKAIPGGRLVVVGDGPMQKIWKSQAEKLGIGSRVQFLGHLSEERKLDLIRKCSALVLPSVKEGFGLTALEAFAFNKPVLVSDVACFREVVRDEFDGFIMSSLSPLDWHKRMKLVLSDRSLCSKMGLQGKTRLLNDFQIEKVGELLERLYEDLLTANLARDGAYSNEVPCSGPIHSR